MFQVILFNARVRGNNRSQLRPQVPDLLGGGQRNHLALQLRGDNGQNSRRVPQSVDLKVGRAW